MTDEEPCIVLIPNIAEVSITKKVSDSWKDNEYWFDLSEISFT